LRPMTRYRFNEVDRCIAGRCVGKNCPCLCHVEPCVSRTTTVTSSDAEDGFRA